MKSRKKIVFYCISIFLLVISVNFGMPYSKATSEYTNKFNVVVVLDASNSMNYTDPQGYRYEAISLFVNLLTEQGNYIGDVVFSNDILSKQDIVHADGQEIKDNFVGTLKQSNPTGYTNIGGGLDCAVSMLCEQGQKDIPSVILFLSDGNTEMPSDDQLENSLELKAEAIQRARENNIQIYSVCLNANAEADVTEMSQIADATGGYFNEVATPEDLTTAFNDFYNMIYGTSTIPIDEQIVPENGLIEKEFELPAFGVEEVNIIIYGAVENVAVTNPSGVEALTTITSSNTYTIVKFSDVESGAWMFRANGNPGSQIKINMVYNTDLTIDIACNRENAMFVENENMELEAFLTSKGKVADEDYQYTGYNATLQVMDNHRNIVKEIPMKIEGGRFVAESRLPIGTYYCKAILDGNHLKKESEEFGPLLIVEAEKVEVQQEENVAQNTPPVALETPIRKTVYKIPFRKAEFEMELTGLAKDNEDTELYYEMISSSFIEGKDYSVEDGKLKMTDFSLSKGGFTVRAYDSMGAYCDIEIVIKSINVGLLTLIALAVGGIIALIVLFILFRICLSLRFRGTVGVTASYDGEETERLIEGRRGRIYLRRFRLGENWKVYEKSYFQATGKDYVYLVLKKPMYFEKKKVKKIKIVGGEWYGTEYQLFTDSQNQNRYLSVSFTIKSKRK